jgi:dsRNA-specific ribonuclease
VILTCSVLLIVVVRGSDFPCLDARVLQDETGVYKNLLQETAHRAGLKLPAYTTVRSGPGHSPVFASTVELAGMSFAGDPAKTKKQAEKNAAMAAWSSLKQSKQSTLAAPKESCFHAFFTAY